MYITLLMQTIDTLKNASCCVNPNDGSSMHRMLTWLQHSNRLENHLLYRVIKQKKKFFVYVQSDTPLNVQDIERYGFVMRGSVCLDFTQNRQIKFSMRVHPTHSVNKKPQAILDADGRMLWYQKKLDDSGLKVQSISEVTPALIQFTKTAKKATVIMCHDVVGYATIEDAEQFRNFVQHGVGKLKNYGAGLFLFN